jgi:guanylate kinase
LILVGCSGSGRSAVIFHLNRKYPHKFERLISHTTRKPRAK